MGSLIFKNILQSSGIFETIEKYIEHEAKEIQGQVILLIGNMCHNNPSLRRYFIERKFHEVMIKIKDSQEGELLHYVYLSWALSILAGVSSES